MQIVSNLLRWWFPLRDWLYILQLEEYELLRYIKHIWPRLGTYGFEQRGVLDNTVHIRLLRCSWWIVLLGVTVCLSMVSGWLSAITIPLILPFITPYLLIPATLLVRPLVGWQKRRELNDLQHARQAHPDVRIIAITGSYGKTTTKYALYQLLKERFATHLVPDNINTALGITHYIKQHPEALQQEYLIVEIGAYIIGDVRLLTDILTPDISVITAIGTQHLERFGSPAAIAQAKYEIFSFAPDATWFTTDRVREKLAEYEIQTDKLLVTNTNGSTTDNVTLAASIARHCGVSERFIADGIPKISLPNRRSNQYETNGVMLIDNSYNISPETVPAVLATAQMVASQAAKQLVVLTAGIGEQGNQSAIVNRAFGEMLNQYANRCIILNSIYAPDILETLTIPHTKTKKCIEVVTKPEQYIEGDKEILLTFPEHTDLAYY